MTDDLSPFGAPPVPTPENTPSGAVRTDARAQNECSPCAHGDEFGYFGLPPNTTHCRDCHATWSGHGRCHCTICHQTFSSYGASDRHWTKRGHVHPSTVKALTCNDNGIWTGVSDGDHWTTKVPAA